MFGPKKKIERKCEGKKKRKEFKVYKLFLWLCLILKKFEKKCDRNNRMNKKIKENKK